MSYWIKELVCPCSLSAWDMETEGTEGRVLGAWGCDKGLPLFCLHIISELQKVIDSDEWIVVPFWFCDDNVWCAHHQNFL